MKAVHKIAAGLALTSFAVTAALAARPMPRKVSDTASEPATGIAAAAAGLNYSTGFETPEFPAGPSKITNGGGVYPAGCGGVAFPCWGHTTAANASTITPTIDIANPFAGTQHLRLTFDTTTRTNITGFGLGVDARYPRGADLSVRPVDVNTVSIEMAIDTPFGQDFRVQPQSNSQGFLATSALFFYAGGIYVLDDVCGTATLNFISTGLAWDTSGAYQNYTVAMNPCEDTITYEYAGAPLYASCTYAGTNLEQFLVFGDNYPGSTFDGDNLVMTSGDGPCPSECGNGVIEGPVETCEPGNNPTGCGPGHACGAVGTPEACTCARICTLASPCELTNGSNGPFYGPFDAQFGGIFIYNAPAGVDAVSVELCGSVGIDQRILYFGSCSDPADPGTANDDCYPGYSGADPSASCYGTVTAPNYESCTCHDNPLDGDNCYLMQVRDPGAAGFVMAEINKKAVCGEAHLGSCCDTNGADQGCTDNALQADCTGADKVWTENGKCANVACDCIPVCASGGNACGDDGCGGSCGPCGDGDVCNGEEVCTNGLCVNGTPLTCNDNNACNGVETCNPSSGCVPGTPLNCSDGDACNGIETCNPSSGCVGGSPVNCDDGRECTVDTCNPADGSCTNDDADCSIPTVSEWGLVVLTLMLLIGAKVYFGRRQAIA